MDPLTPAERGEVLRAIRRLRSETMRAQQRAHGKSHDGRMSQEDARGVISKQQLHLDLLESAEKKIDGGWHD